MNKIKSMLSYGLISFVLAFVLLLSVLAVTKARAITVFTREMEERITKDSPVHKEAVKHLKQNSFDQAIEIERRNLKANPDDLKSYLVLALAYLGKGDEKTARAQAAHVEKINPSYAAELYSSMGRFYLLKKRSYKALHYFNTSLELEKNPAILNQVAVIYLTQKRMNKAKEYFEKASVSEPDYLNISRIFLAEKDYPNVIRSANKALRKNPNLAEGYILLGTAQFLSDDLNQAQSNFLKAKELDPKLVLADYNLGLIHLVEKKYDKALRDFTQIIKLAPKIKEAHINRAVILHIKGERDQAKNAAEKAIKIDPVDFLGYVALGNIYLSEPDFTSADKTYRRAGNLFTEFTLSWFETKDHLNFKSSREAASFTLANIYHRNGLFQHEIKTIQEVPAAETRKNVFMLMMEARAEAKRGNFDPATELYNAVMKLEPKLITPYMELGDLAEQQGDLSKAIDYYKKATKIEPKLSRLYFVLGDLFLSHGDSKIAVSHYQTGLKYAPASSFGHNQIAWILAEKERKYKTALAHARKAYNTSTGNVNIGDTLGWIYYRLNQIEKAVVVYSEVMKASIRNPIVYHHAGVVFQKANKNEHAARAFENALNITDEFPEAEQAIIRLKELTGL